MHPVTYLSFWHVQMSNFPVGSFRRRALPTTEARGMVNAARASGTLVCVAKADLAVPYREDERESYRQLCTALRDHAGIEIHLRDFFGETYSNPLLFAKIGEQQSLLVVDCLYTFHDRTPPDFGAADVLDHDETLQARARRRLKEAVSTSIYPDSIKFYIFEHVEPGT